MLREIGTELWLADGPAVRFLGFFDYPTRMVVARLADGGLWVWSPIALDDALAREVDALGPVRHLVEPNKLHHLPLATWVERYPEALPHPPPGLAKKRPELPWQTELGDEAPAAWASQIDQLVFRGSPALEELFFFHRASRTAIVCDLVQRFDPATLTGWRRWLMRLDGLVGPDGGAPREWRASCWNRRAARASLERALAWDPERLVIAHGVLPEENGRTALAHAFRWLT
ncbi:MAG: DUF4336 domain-containing protein [Myxococcota bacterium]